MCARDRCCNHLAVRAALANGGGHRWLLLLVIRRTRARTRWRRQRQRQLDDDNRDVESAESPLRCWCWCWWWLAIARACVRAARRFELDCGRAAVRIAFDRRLESVVNWLVPYLFTCLGTCCVIAKSMCVCVCVISKRLQMHAM